MLAINPKIKQKAEDIRKKIFGSEVRESLASGIEAISEDVEATIGRQDYVEEQFQDVLDETTGKDVINGPEIIAARNGELNLKTRLDKEKQEFNAQLQQNATALESANQSVDGLKLNKVSISELTNGLSLKRDKTIKIAGSDLDTSSDSSKVQLINLSEEVQSAMAGTAPIISTVEDGSLTSEKYADRSITENKISFKTLDSVSIESYSKDVTITKNNSDIVLEIDSQHGLFFRFSNAKMISLGKEGHATVSRFLPNFGNGVSWQDATNTVVIVNIPHLSHLVYDETDDTLKVVTANNFNAGQKLLASCHNGELKSGVLYEHINYWEMVDVKNKVNKIQTNTKDISVLKRYSNLWYPELQLHISSTSSPTKVYIKFDKLTEMHSWNAKTWDALKSDINNPSLFGISPEGIADCLVLDGDKMLILDASTRAFLVIDRSVYNQSNHILMCTSEWGKPTGGLLVDLYLAYKINDINKISEENTDRDTQIPVYWNDEVDTSINKITQFHRDLGVNATSFGFITDIHNGNNAGYSPSLLKKIMDECNIKYYIDGGDLATDGALTTEEQTINDIKRGKYKYNVIEDKCLRVEGNHDTAYSTLGAPNYYFQNLTPNVFYDVYYRSKTLHDDIVWGDSGDYFYVDDKSAKIRYIGLNSHDKPYEENPDGSVIDNKMWNFAFRQKQITWFAESALNVLSNDWSVVVCSHVAPGDNAEISGNDYPIANYELMLGLLNAFKNNTSYSATGTNEDYPANITIDYSGGGGNVICWLSGHTHRNNMITKDGINIITSINDSLHVSGVDADNKELGTDTEQAFEIVTIDKLNKKVYLTRVGAGEDRQFTY